MLVTLRDQRVKYIYIYYIILYIYIYIIYNIYIYIYIYTLLARKRQCENTLSGPRIYHDGTSGEGGT